MADVLRYLALGEGALAEVMEFDPRACAPDALAAWGASGGVEEPEIRRAVDLVMGKWLPDPLIQSASTLHIDRLAAVVAACPVEFEHGLVRWASRAIIARGLDPADALKELANASAAFARREPDGWRILYRRALRVAQVEARIGVCIVLRLGLNAWQLNAMHGLRPQRLAEMLDLAAKDRLTASALRKRGF